MHLHRPCAICPLKLVLYDTSRGVERPGKRRRVLARLLDATVLCDLACDFQSHESLTIGGRASVWLDRVVTNSPIVRRESDGYANPERPLRGVQRLLSSRLSAFGA